MKSLLGSRGDPGNTPPGPLDLSTVVVPPEGSADWQPGDLLRAMRRHWPLGCAATLAIGLVVTAVVLSIPNRYQSWAAVLIDARPNQVVNLGNVVPDVEANDLAVDSEVQVLQSPGLAQQVIARLQLGRYPQFREGLFTAPLADLLGAATPPRQAVLMNRFLRALKVERQAKSRVIRVAFTARNPALAATVVNTLIRLYLADQVARKAKLTREANALLDKKLAALRADVDAKERAVENWRSRSGLVRGARAPAIDEQISQANAALATARDQLAQARARRAAAVDGTSSAVVDNLLIQHLREREADVERRIAELSPNLGPRHPVMVNLNAELASVRASIGAQVAKVDQTLDEQQRVAAARVAELADTVRRLRTQSASDNDAQVKLRALQREADASRAVLDTFLRRYNETREEASLQQPNARLLGPAQPSATPVFPSRKALLGFGWFVALGLGGFGAPALREALVRRSNPLVRIEVIERAAGPALAVVPTVRSERPHRPSPFNRLIDEPHGAFAEAVGTARTSLLFARAEPPCKIVLMTSATAGEGKTVLAASIARSAALAGEDTLLVDVNLRTPAVHDALDLSNDLGLMDYLERGLDVEALIQIDPRSPLEVMTAGRSIRDMPPLLTLAALTRLFDELRARYRLVILDGPALLGGVESRFLAGAVDEVVLITRADLSPHALSFALRQLHEARVASLRVLINRADLSALEEEVAAAS